MGAIDAMKQPQAGEWKQPRAEHGVFPFTHHSEAAGIPGAAFMTALSPVHILLSQCISNDLFCCSGCEAGPNCSSLGASLAIST